MGVRAQRLRRALYVGRVARRSGLLRVLRELGVWGSRPATKEGAQEFRHALEELGTTYIKLGQLLSSRPDLLPDIYIQELGTLKVGVAPTDLSDFEFALRSTANRIGGAVIVASLLIASALLARVHDLRWMAFAGFCFAFALGLYLLWKIIRTPGEL